MESKIPKPLVTQIKEARVELERRITELNEMPIQDVHPDMVNAMSLEITAQNLRLNALIGMAKREEDPKHEFRGCEGGTCRCQEK